MKTQSFEIHLESEVAVGTPGTVEGGRDTLDYLPGTLFLGATAAALYSQLGDDAWTVFHSGKVRFGDGLPVSPGGLTATPTPKCFAQVKDTTARSGALFNLIHVRRDAGLDGVGAPYLSAAGERVKPETHYRLKTAIDPRSGVSMAHQLYGYHGLRSEGVYHFTLEADDDVSNAVFERLIEGISGSLRLGRSRSAEYGRCRALPIPTPGFESAPAHEGLLHVYLLSHLVVEDPYGAPVSLPTSTQLGLPPAPLVAQACFVRHHHRAHYNGAYRAFESDLFYLERGSVLTYRMDPQQVSQLTANPCRYAGLQRQRGYGRLWLQPPFLMDAHPRFQTRPVVREAEVLPKPNHPLAQWLEDGVTARLAADKIRETAESWYTQLAALYRSAAVRAGLPKGARVGPAPSQWGRVSEAAQRETAATVNWDRLMHTLFHEDDGICKPKDPDWSRVIIHDALEARMKSRQSPTGMSPPPTFLDWLEDKLTQPEADLDRDQRVHVLAHFARFAADRAKQIREQEVLT